MSLDLARLEKVRELASGGWQARCPACAESGQDRTGEHLWIYPDGKFGCCVFPRDSEHRKRIFALAGQRGRRSIQVKVLAAIVATQARANILGRLGRVFGSQNGEAQRPDSAAEISRTARTAVSDSAESVDSIGRYIPDASDTLFILTRVQNEEQKTEDNNCTKLKEFQKPVRSVREEKPHLPHLLADGTLVIPFDSPERYHWWKGKQSVKETLAELQARKKEVEDGATF